MKTAMAKTNKLFDDEEAFRQISFTLADASNKKQKTSMQSHACFALYRFNFPIIIVE